MTNPQIAPAAIGRASHAGGCHRAALAYQNTGLSVLPLKGKRPSLYEWKQHQTERPAAQQIDSRHGRGLLENVGTIWGEVSGNRVVLDFGGVGASAEAVHA
jgi:hypothetical protein